MLFKKETQTVMGSEYQSESEYVHRVEDGKSR